MRLLLDLGGTHCRCGLFANRDTPLLQQRYETRHFSSLSALLEHFLDNAAQQHGDQASAGLVAAFAVASPVSGDLVSLVNGNWQFSQQALRRKLGLASLVCVNDFTANAMALSREADCQLKPIGGGNSLPDGVKGIFGPGTGLGTSALVPAHPQPVALAAEGGHVTLAASNEEEAAVLSRLRQSLGHVSAEKVISGFGLVNLYRSVLAGENFANENPNIDAVGISQLASQGDTNAGKTMALFFDFLGTFAADLAVTLGASGGIYLAGGILPKLEAELLASGFRQRFEDKGRYSNYLSNIPTYLLTDDNLAFSGLHALLDRQVTLAQSGIYR